MGHRQVDALLRDNRIHSKEFLCRVHPYYNDYLNTLAFRTGLKKAQLIRLLIHLAPFNEEFNRIVEGYVRAQRQHYLAVVNWNRDSDIWKWAK